MRGPRVMLQPPCKKRKSGGVDSFTVLNWSICGLNGELATHCYAPNSLTFHYRVIPSLVAPLRWHRKWGDPSPHSRPCSRRLVGGTECLHHTAHRQPDRLDYPYRGGRDDGGRIECVA